MEDLLVAELICVSLILLTGASLLLRSLWNLMNQPLGMRTDSVLTAEVTLGRKSYSEPSPRLAFFEQLEARLHAIPGVTELAVSDSLPPTGNLMGSVLYAGIDVPGRNGPWLAVVGVVGNVKNGGLIEIDDPEYYTVRKHSPLNLGRSATAIIRSGMDPRAVAGWVRAEVAALDPTLPVNIETMQQRVGKLAERPRFNAVLLGIFAAMGLLLAAIGLYGVISFLVAQRTQEIGVRMAPGATPGAITRLVLEHAARWTAAGAVLGLIGSLFAVRLLQAMLFRVSAKDPWTLTAALAVLLGVALLAAWIPSRRAARVDPMQALRQE